MPGHILIVTIGSRGDMQPCVALAKGLQEASYEVVIAGPPNHRDFVSSYGVPFEPIGIDTNEVVKEFAKDPTTPLMSEMWVKSYVDTWRLCEKDKPSLIMFHTSLAVGLELVEEFNIDGIMFEFANWEPCASFPNHLVLENVKGSWEDPEQNWKANVDMINMCWKAQLPLVHGALETVGSKARPSADDYWMERRNRGLKKLHVWSPSFCPTDYRSETDFVTGYWTLKEKETWTPPQDLVNFVEASPVKPIYVGFGSMAVADPTKLRNTVISAIRKSGVRAVVCEGWGSMWDEDDKHEDIFICSECPHSWLFPKMRGLVIHGGAGTVSAALRSGVPSLVVPFFCDQPFWAELMKRKNLTIDAIPIAELEVDNFAAAITQLLSDASIAESCMELSTKILAEDGVSNTLNIIASVMNKS